MAALGYMPLTLTLILFVLPIVGFFLLAAYEFLVLCYSLPRWWMPCFRLPL